MLTKTIITIALLVSLLACMLMGIFSAAGVCAMIFGSEILDKALGNPPNRTHPAFITFMLLMIPGMLVGAIGAIFGIILPLLQKFRIPLGDNNEAPMKWLYGYATSLADYTKPTNSEQNAAEQPATRLQSKSK